MQIDCRDPLYSSSSSCQSISPALRDGIDPNAAANPDTGNPTRTDRINQVYVDTAGTEQSRNSTDTRRNHPFPVNPISEMQRLARQSLGVVLPIFGRDLFDQAPSTFAPAAEQVPPLAGHVIAPGDEVLLRLWGHDSLNSQLTVDSSGSIYVPQAGAIHVAGLRLDQLQNAVKTELSHTFRNFNLSVTLGQLHSIQVYVVGEARKPGAYSVSSSSTLLNALFSSGGPNVQGSLRNIQLRRAGQPTVSFDLYNLILQGDKSKDLRLLPEDVIFIPPVGPQAALAGSVQHPAVYELQKTTTVNDLLTMAGGFSATASQGQIRLDRIEEGQTRRTLDIALNDAGLTMAVRNGDAIYVDHINPGYKDSVTLRGNLANPGQFAWHPGMRLSEIIPDRMSLLTNDYWQQRNLLGVPMPLFEATDRNTEHLSGRIPGSTLSNDRSTGPDREIVSGVPINQYGETPPPSQSSSLLAQELHLDQSNSSTPLAKVTNTRNGVDLGEADTNLTRGSLAEQQESIANENVARRGTPNKIEIPTSEINWSYAVIERLDPETLHNVLIPFVLGRLVQQHDPTQNLELQPGDVVTILSQDDVHVGQDEQTKYVRLEGEFVSSGTYSVQPNETLQDLVVRAGGLTAKAYLFGASFTRQSARVIQQQRLDEYVSTLSIDIERAAATRSASATGVIDPNALVEQRSLITQLKQLRATGRIVLEFKPTSMGVNAIPPIQLENGDVFRVSSRPLTVSVIGAVYGQNVFLYDPSRRVSNYLVLAGNPNRVADKKHAFIIRADGSIYSHDRAQGTWSNNFNTLSINPGDTIVVPEKLIKPSTLREIIDYSQVFSQFALGAAAINVIR